MKNYLAKHYRHYYVLTADGQSYETTRDECIASDDYPTAENPYKQRWFFDAETYSYIVRLPRNQQSEALHRMSEQYTQNAQRYTARKFDCVLKNTGCCDNICDSCQRKRYQRIIELDKPLVGDGENDDGEPRYLDIAADGNGYAIVDEDDAFFAAIAPLTEKQQSLAWLYYYQKKTTYEIAVILGINQSSVQRRLATVKNTLKKTTKDFKHFACPCPQSCLRKHRHLPSLRWR